MTEKDITTALSDKGQELKKLIKDFDANLEQWKFTVEETKEGIRVELAAKALIKSKPKKE
jgi:ribosomal protein L28